jgi:hypothetical protein
VGRSAARPSPSLPDRLACDARFGRAERHRMLVTRRMRPSLFVKR